MRDAATYSGGETTNRTPTRIDELTAPRVTLQPHPVLAQHEG